VPVAEKDITQERKSVKITATAKAELARRAELHAIRRDLLALANEQQKLYRRMLALSQRVYDLTLD
jgi:hypothetical protein